MYFKLLVIVWALPFLLKVSVFGKFHAESGRQK